MKDYNFEDIERKWQLFWEKNKTFKVKENATPKYYVLDMFPYPSGEGLHLGHILCFTATDIIARYKRLLGYNVLHPMGYDAFGLPAEQHAIETGQHPEITTAKNIKNFRRQLKKLGYYYDWDREISTADPKFYKWTQWIFIKLFNSWYNVNSGKAEQIDSLISRLEDGNFVHDGNIVSKNEWLKYSTLEKEQLLSHYRLAYLSEAVVNWCPGLGTVLANEEVVNGVSERGGFPVEKKLMKQWSLRVTSYADRLLEDLKLIDWNESIKEAQRNWIGKSVGVEIEFLVPNHQSIKVFTTRPETIFGVTFLVVAPENNFLSSIVSAQEKDKIADYLTYTKSRSERERISETKKATGVFTGVYALHPISQKQIPIYVGEYVLNNYGTGAIMAVPAHDQRDRIFAEQFGLPIIEVIDENDIMINSPIIDGEKSEIAKEKIISYLEVNFLGKKKINYKIRDAVFGRQRYWGEPIPIYYKDGIPNALPTSKLPLILPEINMYLPTETGEPPLGRANDWYYKKNGKTYPYELTTMPGWAGSSWYYLRYLDPKNQKEFVSPCKLSYWDNVDVYLGGAEHTTGHLIYFRFWTKFLHDLGYLSFTEPAKKLINQGMILGRSNYVYRVKNTNKFVSYGLKGEYDTTSLHVDVSLVTNDILDIDRFRKWRSDFENAEFILEDNRYVCGYENEKMSKSKYNVVSPDTLVNQYGADTLRLYIMFLGPIELTKPWNTQGIEGIVRFLKRVWNIFYGSVIREGIATEKEYKIINIAKKKVKDSLGNNSFNTAISALMICLNELMEVKCTNKEILSDFIVLLSPLAPHLAEEIWRELGNFDSILFAKFPEVNEQYLHNSKFKYPISVNGKVRANIEIDLGLPENEVLAIAYADPLVSKWVNGLTPKKNVFVKGKIINIVL